MSGEWISVSERLPDIGVTVLGWDRDGYHTLHTYMGKNKSGYDVWFGCNVAGGEYEDASSVSEPDFWMPLPAPPTDAKQPANNLIEPHSVRPNTVIRRIIRRFH